MQFIGRNKKVIDIDKRSFMEEILKVMRFNSYAVFKYHVL
jgi:hypothetical protein